MKIRTGFVSNSSSSSFCLFGVRFNNNVKNVISTLTLSEPDDDIDHELFFRSYLNNTNLEVQVCNEEDIVFIGRHYTSIGESETGYQFKTSVKNDLKKLGITKVPEIHQEVYYC